MLLCKLIVQHYDDCYKIIFLSSNLRENMIQIYAIVGLPNPPAGGIHNNLFYQKRFVLNFFKDVQWK